MDKSNRITIVISAKNVLQISAKTDTVSKHYMIS